MPPVAYRYVSKREVSVVQSVSPWRVPNIDRAGKPKQVYFPWDLYTSVSQAETALKIGVQNPAGVFSSPSDRLDLDLPGVTYTFLGIVPGGTGTELTTPDSPLVSSIVPLTLP
jgi:hypothetical protein